MPRVLHIPPEQWRHLLRATLRECTYLPDPVAKEYMRKYVLNRYRAHAVRFQLDDSFRRRYPSQRVPHPWITNVVRQVHLRRRANQTLSLLRRAAEGYLRPLERVLLLSYGRIGPKRHVLLNALLDTERPPLPEDNKEVEEMLRTKPIEFDEDWTPPSILVDLLKAQQRNSAVYRSGLRPVVKSFAPKIPAENIWCRPTPWVRRRNIRRRWFQHAKESILPPLSGDDFYTLKELVSGKRPWKPPARRTKVVSVAEPPVSHLDAKFLVDGPQKGLTFDKYINGRPHKITRRFMRRAWERVFGLVPHFTVDPSSSKQTFVFPSVRRVQALAPPVDERKLPDLFAGLDRQGRVVKTAETPKVDQSDT